MEVFRKIVKMAYCVRCRGKFMAEVEAVANQYGEDTFIKYKTLNCPCYENKEYQKTPETSGQVHQM